MTDQPHDLILDHLRAIRGDTTEIKTALQSLKEGQLSVRDDLHSLRGDIRRQERAIASLETDIDRIKTRLDLAESQDR